MLVKPSLGGWARSLRSRCDICRTVNSGRSKHSTLQSLLPLRLSSAKAIKTTSLPSSNTYGWLLQSDYGIHHEIFMDFSTDLRLSHSFDALFRSYDSLDGFTPLPSSLRRWSIEVWSIIQSATLSKAPTSSIASRVSQALCGTAISLPFPQQVEVKYSFACCITPFDTVSRRLDNSEISKCSYRETVIHCYALFAFQAYIESDRKLLLSAIIADEGDNEEP